MMASMVGGAYTSGIIPFPFSSSLSITKRNKGSLKRTFVLGRVTSGISHAELPYAPPPVSSPITVTSDCYFKAFVNREAAENVFPRVRL